MSDQPAQGSTAGPTQHITLEPSDSRRLAALAGPFDENIKQLEKRLDVEIRNRGNVFSVSGSESRVQAASALLSQLYVETASREDIDGEMVHLYLQESGVDALVQASQSHSKRSGTRGAANAAVSSATAPSAKGGSKAGSSADAALEDSGVASDIIQTRRKTIKARGGNQQGYVQRVREHDISFGVGPAGTGKTYLAVACAVEALEAQDVARILLVRPAVEAGEKLGFLPGDLAQKIDPYLRPLYDALYEMLGVERVNKYIERNIIEVAPLAYMRGRTLNNAFIILDESQNTTVAQMKMFLTRIGFGSTAVITGDITQIDLPHGQGSGLVNGVKVLKGIKGVSFTHFQSKDVVRHPLVQKIVDAYAKEDASHPPRGRDAG